MHLTHAHGMRFKFFVNTKDGMCQENILIQFLKKTKYTIKMEQIHKYSSDLKLAWWGNGEWVEEADEIYWEYKNTSCKITRMVHIDEISEDKISIEDLKTISMFGGHLCGYISIPLDHPWSEKDTSIGCDVHGGCTWNETEKDGKRWIGFDCAHYDDIQPSMIVYENKMMQENAEYRETRRLLEELFSQLGIDRSRNKLFRKTYKNVDFCIKQCENLVDQMLEVLNDPIRFI